jgi:hypothetical protein
MFETVEVGINPLQYLTGRERLAAGHNEATSNLAHHPAFPRQGRNK